MNTRLRELRKARGLTQVDLAVKTGIHRVTIARYDEGRRGMSLKNAAKIADALGCTINELVREEA